MSRYDAYVQAISAGDWDLFSEMSSDEDSRALLRSANRTRGGVSTVTHFRDMHVYCRDLDSSRVVFHSWKGTLGYDLFAVDQLCARMDNTHGPPDWRRGSDRVHPREFRPAALVRGELYHRQGVLLHGSGLQLGCFEKHVERRPGQLHPDRYNGPSPIFVE